jgi:3D (Asp-Asp-Asp) domain-containing protein
MAPLAMGAMPTTMPGTHVSAAPGAGANPSAAPQAAGAQRTPERLRTKGRLALASAYDGSDEGNACPGFPQTRVNTLSIGTNLIPCGARMRICIADRCALVQRRDTGPFIKGRTIDVNIGVAHALGFRGVYEWGVRTVRWEPVGGPARTVASTRAR